MKKPETKVEIEHGKEIVAAGPDPSKSGTGSSKALCSPLGASKENDGNEPAPVNSGTGLRDPAAATDPAAEDDMAPQPSTGDQPAPMLDEFPEPEAPAPPEEDAEKDKKNKKPQSSKDRLMKQGLQLGKQLAESTDQRKKAIQAKVKADSLKRKDAVEKAKVAKADEKARHEERMNQLEKELSDALKLDNDLITVCISANLYLKGNQAAMKEMQEKLEQAEKNADDEAARQEALYQQRTRAAADAADSKQAALANCIDNAVNSMAATIRAQVMASLGDVAAP